MSGFIDNGEIKVFQISCSGRPEDDLMFHASRLPRPAWKALNSAKDLVGRNAALWIVDGFLDLGAQNFLDCSLLST